MTKTILFQSSAVVIIYNNDLHNDLQNQVLSILFQGTSMLK